MSSVKGRHSTAGRGKWEIQQSFDLDAFLGQSLVARVATVGRTGPTVRPLWYLWEEHAFGG
jgi:nitroimidazol reductase NimA-like FMN-containing flavoprotein (pyridoxamine 5'-phosphate oxidase superfamily)